MTTEESNTEQTTPTPTPDPVADLLGQLQGSLESTFNKLTKRLEEVEQRIAEPKKPAVPFGVQQTPAALPQQERIRQLEQSAIQAQITATKYQLASEFGIDPNELGDDYLDPDAMRRDAQRIANLKRLEKRAEEQQEAINKLLNVQTQQPVEQEQPIGDTGGATSETPSSQAQLEELYQRVRQMKPGEDAVAAHLTTAYRDISRAVGTGPVKQEV